MKVLIAEDDFRVAGIHQEFIRQIAGVEVIEKATTAAETISFLKEKTLDILLLDIYMPDQQGTELLAVIRKVQPNITIIVITATTERAVFRKAYQYGVTDFLIKPITFERFEHAISKARSRHMFLQAEEQISQEDADRFFAYTEADGRESSLPKGIDPITLDKVKALLKNIDGGITADAMSESLGASRTTSRRYLEYLITIKEARAELEYGLVGRPERLYHKRARKTMH